MNDQAFLSRARGCMIGLAIGDAMGDIGRSDLYRNRYGIVTDMYAGVKSTDDTEFAILTARTLVDCGGQLTSAAVTAAWEKYILGQGGMFDRGGKPLYGAVENLKRGLLPPQTGLYNVMNNDDGAAMRIAPVGILCSGDPQRAAVMAEIDAQMSHAGDGIAAAQAVAASVAVATAGGSAAEVVQAGLAQIPAASWLGYSMAKMMAICDQAGSIEAAWQDLHNVFWTPVHSACEEALPQIYGIYRLTDGDFRRGMFWASNFGRDADTIAAVVGAMAGGRQGIEAIPAEWVEKARQPSGVCLRFSAQEDVLDLADQLVKLAAQS